MYHFETVKSTINIKSLIIIKEQYGFFYKIKTNYKCFSICRNSDKHIAAFDSRRLGSTN